MDRAREIVMSLIRHSCAAAAAAAVLFLTGCGTMRGHDHGAYGGSASPMHEMHQKMAAAKTPQERQALMSEHMKAMHEGMGMMRGMNTDPAWREQMQSQCSEMMKSMNVPAQ
jgi:hypothetical protein